MSAVVTRVGGTESCEDEYDCQRLCESAEPGSHETAIGEAHSSPDGPRNPGVTDGQTRASPTRRPSLKPDAPTPGRGSPSHVSSVNRSIQHQMAITRSLVQHLDLVCVARWCTPTSAGGPARGS